MINQLITHQQRAESIARKLVIATALAVPLPTAWVGLTTALFLATWLLAGQFTKRWMVIRQNPIALAALAVFAWIVISIGWSQADLPAAARHAWQFRELLLLALMLSVTPADQQTRERWQTNIFNAFLLGFGLALTVSFMRWFNIVPERVGGRFGGFVGHTGFSVTLAFVAYSCLNRLYPPRHSPGTTTNPAPVEKPWLWAMLGLVCLGNLLFINTGRSGQLVFLAFIPLALYSRLARRGLILSIVAVPLIATATYFSSPVVQGHIQQSLVNLEQFRQGQTETSDGLRLEYWQHTLGFIRETPIIGLGSGGYGSRYQALATELGLTGGRISGNPHNEYLLLTSEQGLIGLALLLMLWATQWRVSARLPPNRREMLRAIVILMMVGDLVNSFLLDNFEGHLYLVLTIAMGALGPPKPAAS